MGIVVAITGGIIVFNLGVVFGVWLLERLETSPHKRGR